MITLKYGDFRNGVFGQVWPKVMTFDKYPIQTLYQVTKMGKAIDKHVKEMSDLHIVLIKKYATMDEKGNIAPRKNEKGQPVPGTYVVAEEKQEEWKKELEAFDALPVQVDREKLSAEKLLQAGLNLTPQEMIILEEVIE